MLPANLPLFGNPFYLSLPGTLFPFDVVGKADHTSGFVTRSPHDPLKWRVSQRMRGDLDGGWMEDDGW